MALFPWLNFLLKSWHPIEAHWELGLQHVNFEGEHKIQWWSRYKMHAPFQKGVMRKENSDESHASLIHSMANSMKFWSQDILFSLMLCLPDLLEWPFCLCSPAKWGIVPLGPWMDQFSMIFSHCHLRPHQNDLYHPYFHILSWFLLYSLRRQRLSRLFFYSWAFMRVTFNNHFIAILTFSHMNS